VVSLRKMKAESSIYHRTNNTQSVIFNNARLKFVLTAFSAVCLGAIILVFGSLSYKWVFVLVFSGFFLIFVVAMGSLERALQALLIFSLFTIMDVNPWLSDRYATLKQGIPITLTSIIIVVLYLLWLVRVSLKKESVRLFPLVTIPFSLIVLLSELSSLTAVNSALVIACFPRLLTAFLLFIYMANFLRSKEDIQFAIKCLAIAIAFSGILGILQYVSGPFPSLSFLGPRASQVVMDYSGVSISRVSGLFGHPNNFAYLMVGFLPIMLICTIANIGFGLRVLCFFSFSLGLTSLILTFSRNGWFSLVTSLLMIAILLFKRKRQEILHGALVRFVILGLFAMVLIIPYFSQIVTRLTSYDYGAAYSRITLAQSALKVIKIKPIKGVGLGNYRIAVPYYDSNVYVNRYGVASSVHNMYLRITAELGLPTFAIFLWMSILIFRQGIIALNSTDEFKYLFALGLLAGFAGVYLYGMFEDIFFGDPRFVTLSAMAGLLMAFKYYYDHNISNRKLTDI